MPRFGLWTCIAVPLRWATTGWQCQPPGKHGPVFAGFSPLSLSSPSVLFVIFFSGRRFCLTTSRSGKDVRLLVEFVFRQENSRKWQGNHHRTQPGRRPQPPPTLIPCGFPRHSPVLRVPPGSRHSTKPNGKGLPTLQSAGAPSSRALLFVSRFAQLLRSFKAACGDGWRGSVPDRAALTAPVLFSSHLFPHSFSTECALCNVFFLSGTKQNCPSVLSGTVPALHRADRSNYRDYKCGAECQRILKLFNTLK